jgi:hypothetical protein
LGTVQWRTLCEILGGGARGHAPQNIFKIRTRKWHLQHSENTFVKDSFFKTLF